MEVVGGRGMLKKMPEGVEGKGKVVLLCAARKKEYVCLWRMKRGLEGVIRMGAETMGTYS